MARLAGAYSRQYRPGHAGIDTADYLVAATTTVLGAELLTTNVKHYPMFKGLRAPYVYLS